MTSKINIYYLYNTGRWILDHHAPEHSDFIPVAVVEKNATFLPENFARILPEKMPVISPDFCQYLLKNQHASYVQNILKQMYEDGTMDTVIENDMVAVQHTVPEPL